MKFHLTDNGPRHCRADSSNPKSTGCRFGDHYKSLSLAERAYEDSLLDGETVSTVSPPPQSLIPEGVLKKLEKMLPEGSIAYTLQGSRLYGLASKDSDYDFLAVTATGKARQYIEGDVDLITVSLPDFLGRLSESRSAEVQALAGGGFVFLKEGYGPLFRSIRFNSYKYMNNLSSESFNHLTRLLAGKTPHRVEKVFRTVSRNTIFSEKVLKEGAGFSSRLDAAKAEKVRLLSADAISAFERGEGLSFFLKLFNLEERSLGDIGFEAGGL